MTTAADTGAGGVPAPPSTEPTTVLSFGPAWLKMPNLVRLLSFNGVTPDPYLAAVMDLLTQEGAYKAEDDPSRYRNKAEHLKGMLGLFKECLVYPKLNLAVEQGSGPGEIGNQEFAWYDVEFVYYTFFRAGAARPPRRAAAAVEPAGAQDAAQPGEGVRDAPEPAAGA
jgi:hypothetical protein